MHQHKKQMTMFMRNFKSNPDRLKKYAELLLLGRDASPYSFLSRKNIRCVTIALTTKCNLKCVWCHRNETRFQKYLQKDMPIETLRTILPTLKGIKRLYFGGLGEPTLHPEIYDAIKDARQYVPDVRITTNGVMLKKEVGRKLIDAGLSYIEVSIDGFDGETNKKMRGVMEDKVLENLKYFSDNSDIPIQINSVISNSNYDALFGAIDKLKDIKNVVLLHTIPLFMTEHMMELGINDISSDQHKKLLTHWKDCIQQFSLNIRVWPDINETQLDPVITLKRRHNLCFSVFEDPFINVDGHLTPCGRLQEKGLEDVAKAGFDAAWNGPKMVTWRKQILKGNPPSICQLECHLKNQCISDKTGK